MIVCLCQGVSDSQIRHAIQAGYATLPSLVRYLKVGMGAGCGACHASLRALLQQAATQNLPQPPKSAAKSTV